MTKQSLEDVVSKLINLHKEGCFNFECVDADLQFDCVDVSFFGATVDTCDADDHIEVVERYIRTMKE